MSSNQPQQLDPNSKKGMKKLLKQQQKERLKAEKLQASLNNVNLNEKDDFSFESYGKLPLNRSQSNGGETRKLISEISDTNVGNHDWFRMRVQYTRAQSSKLVFITLRQEIDTIQGVVAVDKDKVSEQMAKFCAAVQPESILLVYAKIVKAPTPVVSCTVSKYELHITKFFVIQPTMERLPFTVEEASGQELQKEDGQTLKINLDTRLNNRVIDLRTIQNQAIFRIQSHVCSSFRSFLLQRNFFEIHTPKIMGYASEGGANVFGLEYFKKKAFLAQSPQLAKQIAVASFHERVFEIGPVFRAEDSNTHRHMTEFTGLDLEMAFEHHYHEVVDLIDLLFINIFDTLSKLTKELNIINTQYSVPKFEYWKDKKSLRLEFKDAVKLLNDNGIKVKDYEDLSTENEKKLGQLVKEKYNTDFFILDKFPLAVRPFYTMPDPNDERYSNSYDFFMRGEEIMSGAQRIHDPDLLIQRAKLHNVDLETITPYLQAFKYAAPPHAGGGIGLERVVMLYLGLGNIRRSSMFPRDPKRLEP